MLIDEVRPRSIIELGSGAGGMVLPISAQVRTERTQITSIDRAAVEGIDNPRITFIQAALRALAPSRRKIRQRIFRAPACCGLSRRPRFLLSPWMRSARPPTILSSKTAIPSRAAVPTSMPAGPYLIDSKFTDFFSRQRHQGHQPHRREARRH